MSKTIEPGLAEEPKPARKPRPRQALRPEGSNIPDGIAGEIGLRIVRGDYPPGTILPNEAQWAETFKVSRSVVREAVKMLNAKGLLVSRPKIGSRVEPRERWNLLDRDVLAWYAKAPDPKDFLPMIQEFRHLIEPEAGAFAARRRSAEALADITRACEAMRQAPSPEAWYEANLAFHLAILTASGNDLLLPLGVMVETALRHLFAFIRREDVDLREIQNQHEAIERAIRLKRPQAARRALQDLLSNTDAILARKLKDDSGQEAMLP